MQRVLYVIKSLLNFYRLCNGINTKLIQIIVHLLLELGGTDLSEVCLLYFHQQQNILKEGIFGTTKKDYTMLLIF